ncbi:MULTISPECIES: hypothetical protein, partial [unclassified Aquimarina]|uniref:hypothetical protein n=1 Tax=unclassified Aquimarina TaxID=2627091 RepID=UPI001E639F08
PMRQLALSLQMSSGHLLIATAFSDSTTNLPNGRFLCIREIRPMRQLALSLQMSSGHLLIATALSDFIETRKTSFFKEVSFFTGK